MKYIFLLLLLSSVFFLSACFEKKQEDVLSTGSVMDSGSLETQLGDTDAALGELSQESSGANVGEVSPGVTTPQLQIPSQQVEISSGEQKEIVQEAEQDLEALFDDLMKSE